MNGRGRGEGGREKGGERRGWEEGGRNERGGGNRIDSKYLQSMVVTLLHVHVMPPENSLTKAICLQSI